MEVNAVKGSVVVVVGVGTAAENNVGVEGCSVYPFLTRFDSKLVLILNEDLNLSNGFACLYNCKTLNDTFLELLYKNRGVFRPQ